VNLRKLDTRNFVAIVISAVSAGIVGRIFLGEQPAFDVPAYALSHLGELPIYLMLGVLSALLAVLFIRLLYFLEGFFDDLKLPLAFKAAIGMLLTGAVALLLADRQVLGPGLDFIGEAISQDFQMSLGLLLGLLLLKLLATSFTLGSGNSGGVFAPALFMGAILGGMIGQLAHGIFPGVAAHPGAYAIVGMAAVFAGAARAPMTGILIVFEMSNDYRLILPLMLGTVVATLLAELLFEESIYTLKLKLRGIRLPEQREIDIMQGVKVGEAMSEVREAVRPDMPLSELAAVFERCHHHGLPVVDGSGCLLGVVSVQDLTEALGEKSGPQKTVIDIATTENVQLAYPDEPMWMALRRLGAGELSVVPVVARDMPNLLLGVVRRRNVVHAYNQAIARHANYQHRSEALGLGKLDGAGFYQIEIDVDSPVCGQQVRAIDLPRECLLVSVRRGRKLRAIHGDTVLQAGDQLTLFAHEDHISGVREKFSGEQTGRVIENEVHSQEVSIGSHSRWVSRTVGELALPPNCILASIRRNGRPVEISAAARIEAGDVFQLIGADQDLDGVIALLNQVE
jgi:CIC family chloride channel protein